MNTALQEETLRHWLALWLAPGIGSKLFKDLLTQHPSLPTLFRLRAPELEQLKVPPYAIQAILNPNWQAVDLHLQWACHANQHIITWHNEHYSQLLKHIHDPPPLLFIKGDPASLHSPQIAMVGSRQCSPTGSYTARSLAAQLARAGFTITSGLALGIDGASHQGALDAQGKTIAVLGTGLAILYPKQHQELAEKIAANGALISEFPLSTPARAQHFPRRNRLISGLALGTLVVEASLRSGSLITARYALEQGRDVFAVPGSIYHSASQGCHTLIKQGAKLVETVEDILEDIDHSWKSRYLSPPTDQEKEMLPVEYQHLITYIDYSVPVPLDRLVEQLQQPIEKITEQLLSLELEGYITAVPGGYIRRLTTDNTDYE